MGCLNSTGKFDHWFGNIHLSGPCNRSCYFCVGQHMMALDAMNNLDEWPLQGLDEFVKKCKEKGISKINLTGTNTDPLLYKHLRKLRSYLWIRFPFLSFGVRTNGALWNTKHVIIFDRISVSITTFDKNLYQQTMGESEPPNLRRILKQAGPHRVKVNVVLCPETVEGGDIVRTLLVLAGLGVRTVNLREPYGQPHIGHCLGATTERLYGMPLYRFGDMEVVYWDVHYVEVESVNLYASGRISTDYPITRGHHPDGVVKGQEHFATSGRQQEQWLSTRQTHD